MEATATVVVVVVVLGVTAGAAGRRSGGGRSWLVSGDRLLPAGITPPLRIALHHVDATQATMSRGKMAKGFLSTDQHDLDFRFRRAGDVFPGPRFSE